VAEKEKEEDLGEIGVPRTALNLLGALSINILVAEGLREKGRGGTKKTTP